MTVPVPPGGAESTTRGLTSPMTLRINESKSWSSRTKGMEEPVAEDDHPGEDRQDELPKTPLREHVDQVVADGAFRP